MDANENFRLK